MTKPGGSMVLNAFLLVALGCALADRALHRTSPDRIKQVATDQEWLTVHEPVLVFPKGSLSLWRDHRDNMDDANRYCQKGARAIIRRDDHDRVYCVEHAEWREELRRRGVEGVR